MPEILPHSEQYAHWQTNHHQEKQSQQGAVQLADGGSVKENPSNEI